jgi:DNA-binding response OmpR family regulator
MARRILVVDDSATEQQAIRNPLVADGFQVVVASNGDEALQQLETDEFDLMVLDVIMPGKNGFQIARMIRNDARWAKLPIVMVTSKDGSLLGTEAGRDRVHHQALQDRRAGRRGSQT